MASINGKRVVFTGELESMTRAEAQAKAKALGATVASTVNAETDLLVAGPGAGSKLAAALKHGVKVLNEAAWIKMASGGGKSATKKVATKSAKKAATKKAAKKSAKKSARKPSSHILAERGRTERTLAKWKAKYLADAQQIHSMLNERQSAAGSAQRPPHAPVRIDAQSSGTAWTTEWWYLRDRDLIVGDLIWFKEWRRYSWNSIIEFAEDAGKLDGRDEVFNSYGGWDTVESRSNYRELINGASLQEEFDHDLDSIIEYLQDEGEDVSWGSQLSPTPESDLGKQFGEYIESGFRANGLPIYNVTLYWDDGSADLCATEKPEWAGTETNLRIHLFDSVEESVAAGMAKLRDSIA